MSAIITNNFRRESRQRFIDNIQYEEANSAGYYIGLGKSDQWQDDESSYPVPLPNGALIADQDIKDNLMALVKVSSNAVLFPRNEMRSGRVYKVFDPTDPLTFDLEDQYYPCIATHNNRVYVCLNNNDNNTISAFPQGTTYGIEEAVSNVDGNYIWAYVQDVVTTSDFYTEEFIPAAIDPVNLVPAKTATGGLVYGFNIDSGGSGLSGNEKIYLRGIDENGANITQVDLNTDSKFTVTYVGNSITDISYADIANVLTGYLKVSVEVYASDGVTKLSAVKIRPLVAKIAGFGSAPSNELPTFYIGCYAKFQGNVDGEAVTDVPFRQISLIKNPQRLNQVGDDGYAYGDSEALDALNYLQLNTNAATQTHVSGSVITQGDAIAYLDKVDLINDRIYYHRNSNHDVNYVPFTVSDFAITSSEGVDSYLASDIVTVEESEYIHDSGDVIFVDHRAKITRNVDQTEDIKIVIQF